ncbi:MAG: hypothetical protein ACPGJS_03795 [Flammeovirgaceae bacterium]
MDSNLSFWRILMAFQLTALLIVMGSAYIGTPVVHYKQYDFYVHFLLFGITSYLAHRASNRKKTLFFKVVLPVWPVIFIVLSCLEESLQLLSEHRTFSLFDMLGNVFGITFFSVLDNLWLKWTMSNESN